MTRYMQAKWIPHMKWWMLRCELCNVCIGMGAHPHDIATEHAGTDFHVRNLFAQITQDAS